MGLFQIFCVCFFAAWFFLRCLAASANPDDAYRPSKYLGHRINLLRFASWYLTLTDELTIGNGEHGAVTLIMKTFMAMNFDDVLDLSAEVQSGT